MRDNFEPMVTRRGVNRDVCVTEAKPTPRYAVSRTKFENVHGNTYKEISMEKIERKLYNEFTSLALDLKKIVDDASEKMASRHYAILFQINPTVDENEKEGV